MSADMDSTVSRVVPGEFARLVDAVQSRFEDTASGDPGVVVNDGRLVPNLSLLADSDWRLISSLQNELASEDAQLVAQWLVAESAIAEQARARILAAVCYLREFLDDRVPIKECSQLAGKSHSWSRTAYSEADRDLVEDAVERSAVYPRELDRVTWRPPKETRPTHYLLGARPDGTPVTSPAADGLVVFVRNASQREAVADLLRHQRCYTELPEGTVQSLLDGEPSEAARAFAFAFTFLRGELEDATPAEAAAGADGVPRALFFNDLRVDSQAKRFPDRVVGATRDDGLVLQWQGRVPVLEGPSAGGVHWTIHTPGAEPVRLRLARHDVKSWDRLVAAARPVAVAAVPH